jgi:serine/arginine repetitive matrix protein 1
VNLKLLRTWIEHKLAEVAGIEDEVVTNFVITELEVSDEKGPDPKRLEINLEGKLLLSGFLETRTRPFVSELWEMLIASQNSPEGIVNLPNIGR